MATLRSAHQRNYSSIANSLTQNNNLSLRARGLMAYFLSLPDDWKIHVNHLVKVMKEGRDAILSTIKELKEAGYVHLVKEGFKGCWNYLVFEEAISPKEFKNFLRTNGFPNNWENQQLANPQLQSTNPSTKDLPKTNPPLTPPQRRDEDSFLRKKLIGSGRKDELILEKSLKKLHEQPFGEVKSGKKWLMKVYDNFVQQSLMDDLEAHRRNAAERRGGNWNAGKDLLCITSGSIEKKIKYRGDEKFWETHGLGKKQYLEHLEKKSSCEKAAQVGVR